MPKEQLISAEMEGMRLDAALGHILPTLSVRARRRSLEQGLILVNGKKAKPGLYVRAGMRLSFSTPCNESQTPEVRLIDSDQDYCFFAKPRFLHTESLAGSQTPSLAAAVTALWPQGKQGILLQRLDYETSGIVAAACHTRSVERFREAERAGQVNKKYVCLLQGALAAPLLCQNKLVSAGGKSVRALAQRETESARWTQIVPLAQGNAQELGLPFELDPTSVLTLAGCCIQRGFRHQIRVHAAHAGYPLLFDSLYQPATASQHAFYLHHGRLEACAHTLVLLPDWHVADKVQALIAAWLESPCASDNDAQ